MLVAPLAQVPPFEMGGAAKMTTSLPGCAAVALVPRELGLPTLPVNRARGGPCGEAAASMQA